MSNFFSDVPTGNQFPTLPDYIDVMSMDCESIIKNYLNRNKKRKDIQKESHDFIRSFMQDNQSQIVIQLNKRNKVKSKKDHNFKHYTINQLLEIALGWNIEDIDPLLRAAKQKKFNIFVNILFNY
jgi:hypothetical protein